MKKEKDTALINENVSDDEYTSSEEEKSSVSEESSEEDLSSEESEDDLQLFTVQTGECPGSIDRIVLLSTKEVSTINSATLDEEGLERLFKGICIWAEAESTEKEPWITGFFSILKYEDISPYMFHEVSKKIEALHNCENMRVFISGRFMNLPDEVVYEMYTALPTLLPLQEKEKILFISVEKPIRPTEEKEIKAVFPSFNFTKAKNMFPVYAEEVFLSLNKINPVAMVHSSGKAIKLFLLDKQMISVFLSSLDKYFQE
ncbi:hypothetical protein NEFER03_1976 [Nematocida sp. LUAm3]|nr:hypothetical protein NEFER03_1976 [Nematocida sp. LUAm3]KAI5176060.1 hypothetical protein NEFER02_1894 [Nematocida sp. LUAm2]KAI5177104.1 hypothetical protein NEFER01_0379 [Nematocida sp. LUAm1]